MMSALIMALFKHFLRNLRRGNPGSAWDQLTHMPETIPMPRHCMII